MPMIRELSPNKLRRKLTLSEKQCRQIREDAPLRFFVGQQRAKEAFNFGIENKGQGFNIYVSGYPGSGKLTAIKHFLQEKAKTEDPPGDYCYVNNFSDPYCPKMLKLEKGGARVFRNEMAKLIEEAQSALLNAFESKEYANKRQEITDEYKKREIDLFRQIDEKASANHFAISRTPIEIVVVPKDEKGNPISDKAFSKMSKKKQEEIIHRRNILMDEVNSLLRQNRELERELSNALVNLDHSVALYSIEELLEELRNKYKKNREVVEHLDDVKDQIIAMLADFLRSSMQKRNSPGEDDNRWMEFDVNIITDNSELEGAPIIMEFNPTYFNLFGKVEHESEMGTLVTDFTLIRGGSLHKANGGYLIVPLKDLLLNYFSWDSLKRALKNAEVVIEDAGERFGFMSAKSLKPDPIPLHVQIVLIGSPWLYHLLYRWDEDFKELFGVKAEFDTSMEYSVENSKDFASVIFKIEKEQGLMPMNHEAIGRMLEESCRMADDQHRISIRFGELSKILREADHYARREGFDEIDSAHIDKAIESKYFRSNLIQEKINDLIRRNTLMIELEGSKIGQINGISVIDLGDIQFGRPNKITVSVASGKQGLIDIEREVKLGGPIHSKGVLILNGYLNAHYGQDKQISLVASLVFEQSYSEIEGDSASSAELYAILSGLSEVSLKQGIAVTGSVNQKGEIQPIGAVNEKIEGYYEVCRQYGLNKKQGVIIPRSNVDNLMLKPEVVSAVNKGLFHIWAVDTIDQGLEILTGFKAGKKLKRGNFSPNSIHYLVDQRIKALSRNLISQKAKSETR